MANEQNLMTPEEVNARLTPEQRRANAIKAGKASGAARREHKTIAETLRKLLDEPDEQGVTRMEKLIAKTAHNLYKKGDIKDVKVLAEIMGELKTNVALDGHSLVISVKNEAEAQDVNDIINREQ